MIKKVDLLLRWRLSLLLLLANVAVFAQNSFGVSGGGGFTQSTGFRAALPVEIRIKNNTALFGGPAFLMRRNQEIIRKLDAARDYYTVETNYLSLPVMVKLRLDWEPIHLYGLFGIEVNYGLRMQATGVEDQTLFKEKLDFDHIQLSRLDGGVTVGGGFEAELRNFRKIFADLRYYLGILDIDQSPDGEIFQEGTYVTLGFMMPFFQPKE
ncbi:MAG: porin family protein [Saprospiraceae bacterium]|nr:PorT family protein [Lewinella sp.]